MCVLQHRHPLGASRTIPHIVFVSVPEDSFKVGESEASCALCVIRMLVRVIGSGGDFERQRNSVPCR